MGAQFDSIVYLIIECYKFLTTIRLLNLQVDLLLSPMFESIYPGISSGINLQLDYL